MLTDVQCGYLEMKAAFFNIFWIWLRI